MPTSLAQQAVDRGYVKSVDEYNSAESAGKATVANMAKNAPASTEPKSAVSVVSSTKGKQTLDPLVADQKLDEANLATASANKKATAATVQNINTSGAAEYTQAEANEIGIDLNSAKLNPATGKYLLPEDVQVESTLTQTKKDLDEIDKVFKSQQDEFDDAQQAVYESIKGIYSQLAEETKESNKRAYASYQNFGIREGGQRYAGEINQGILNAEERAGLGRLQDIAVKQAEALANAKSAAATNSWAVFKEKRAEIASLKEQRQKEITALREKGQKRLDDARKLKEKENEKMIQASRDNSIADLVSQGVTDPKKVLKYLNYDDTGAQVGDYSIDEVSKALNVLVPKPKTGPATNKITLSEARTSKLPLSVVGMSEADLVSSFKENIAPDWFRQKVESEHRQNLLPETLQSVWDEYKASFGQEEEKTTYEKSASTTKEKATEFFREEFGLDDSGAEAYGDQVKIYVAGGLPYAKAIRQAMLDAGVEDDRLVDLGYEPRTDAEIELEKTQEATKNN